MTEDDDSTEDALFRAETIPPPDGDDAYSAPTKVGAMASTVMQEMIVAAQEAAERAYEAERGGEESKATPPAAPARPKRTSVPPANVRAVSDVEELLDLSPDEDDAATSLSPLARPPKLPDFSRPRASAGGTALLAPSPPVPSPSAPAVPSVSAPYESMSSAAASASHSSHHAAVSAQPMSMAATFPVTPAPPGLSHRPMSLSRAPIPFVENALAEPPKSRAPIIALVCIAVAATLVFLAIRVVEAFQ